MPNIQQSKTRKQRRRTFVHAVHAIGRNMGPVAQAIGRLVFKPPAGQPVSLSMQP
jgi:hypothetical protein